MVRWTWLQRGSTVPFFAVHMYYRCSCGLCTSGCLDLNTDPQCAQDKRNDLKTMVVLHSQQHIFLLFSKEAIYVKTDGSFLFCFLGFGDRPRNRCRFCCYTSVSRWNMKTHERIHTGERPFVCGQCSRAFSDKCNLKRHERVHTGERPFRCPICGASFLWRASYKGHMRCHNLRFALNPHSFGWTGNSMRQNFQAAVPFAHSCDASGEMHNNARGKPTRSVGRLQDLGRAKL